MKKNNTAEKNALKAEEISKALRENTEKSVQSIIKEAISQIIRESEDVEEDEPVEDDSYEEEDVNTVDTPETDEETATEEPETEEEEGEAVEEGEEGTEEISDDADDEWSDEEEYKVGDNEYDFTGVDGDTVLKVFNKLGDDDKIFVKKEDDGSYTMEDEETGAEYVIELDSEDADAESEESEPVEDDFEAEFDDDVEEPEVEDDEIEIDLGDEDEPTENEDEIELDLNDEEENDDEELNEDLGYTDSYQKDVFDKKFNMSEPGKDVNDWDGGAPNGAEKPWAGKGDMKPFGEKKDTIDECGMQEELEEQQNVGGAVQQHTVSKSNIPSGRKNYGPKVKHEVSDANNGFEGNINEEKMRKIVNAAKAIQKENKQYKEAIESIKKSLYEAAAVNANLAKVVKLFVNESTTKEEKISILNKFNSVRTIKEGNELYNAIKRELNESKKSNNVIVERQLSVNESKGMNEINIYSNPSLDLMHRMDNLFK